MSMSTSKKSEVQVQVQVHVQAALFLLVFIHIRAALFLLDNKLIIAIFLLCQYPEMCRTERRPSTLFPVHHPGTYRQRPGLKVNRRSCPQSILAGAGLRISGPSWHSYPPVLMPVSSVLLCDIEGQRG